MTQSLVCSAPLANNRPEPISPAVVAGYLALALAFLAGGAGTGFIDPDSWHQMALFREALVLGQLPRSDPFAYTSTVEPLVHHEWGTGALLYVAGTGFGALGFALLRDTLALSVAALCVACARRRGAEVGVLWATLPVAVLMAWIGVTTVRAQMFTLLFLALLLWFLELDRAGRRWWIAPWLVAYVLWVNLHAGFIVGAVAFALHGLEQLARGKPFGHLLAVGLAMAALVAVTPYGLDYYAYLWHGLRMDRPLITEWRSLLHAWWPLILAYGVSLLIAAYALYRGGLRRATGMLFVFAAAYAAARHQRHLSLYAVAWASTVPSLLQGTPLAAILGRALAPTRRGVAIGAVAAAVLAGGAFLQHRPWAPAMPANPGDHSMLLYPVGAVDYLRDQGFRGNLLTPFEAGAFVSWRLYPDVLVSLDGRYEVAYAPELLDRHLAFYRAAEGWQGLLEDTPTDAVLVRADAAVAEALPRLAGWRVVYRDDAYEVFTREAALPYVDRRGELLVGSFP